MRNKSRKFWPRLAIRLFVALLVLITAFVSYFLIIAIDHPPSVSDYSCLEVPRIDHGNNTFTIGKNWLRKSDSGLWEAYIEGDPFERGVAFGRLTRELLYYQEASFVKQIRQLVPSQGYLRILKYFTAFFNRNLDKHITEEYKLEIYGTSLSCSKEFDYIGSGYQRQLNYHAAHDIGHALQGLNLVACTSFSVWDSRSADSSLLVGRNFDFYMGPEFAKNKIVCFVNSARGYRFMMITWADLIGVVSGMNEKGLTVTLNAAKSSIPGQAATPVTLLAREILQYASTIEEAYAISKKRKLFVSESLMIGSARDGKTAIIEKSPDQYDIVYPEKDYIVCTNHFQGVAFADERRNIENIRFSDSRERYERVEALISRTGKFDVRQAIDLLRDQKGKGDSDIGMGNQLAINQLIAHHSVVFKPDSLMAWVSTAPWQLGKYVAYDLKKIFHLEENRIVLHEEVNSTGRNIPADSFMSSPGYASYMKYLDMTNKLRSYKSLGTRLPPGFEQMYIQSNPRLYLTYVHLGDYFIEIGDDEKADSCYLAALTCKLPGLDAEHKLRKTIKKMHK
jgi:hypothetical protein